MSIVSFRNTQGTASASESFPQAMRDIGGDFKAIRSVLGEINAKSIEGKKEGSLLNMLPGHARDIGIDSLKLAAKFLSKSRIDFYAVRDPLKLKGIAIDMEITDFENSFGHLRRNSSITYVDGRGYEVLLKKLRLAGGYRISNALYEIRKTELRGAVEGIISGMSMDTKRLAERCRRVQSSQIDNAYDKEQLWLFMISLVRSDQSQEFQQFLRYKDILR